MTSSERSASPAFIGKKVALDSAAKSLRDLRIAEIGELDMQLEDGQIRAYRAKVKVSFKC